MTSSLHPFTGEDNNSITVNITSGGEDSPRQKCIKRDKGRISHSARQAGKYVPPETFPEGGEIENLVKLPNIEDTLQGRHSSLLCFRHFTRGLIATEYTATARTLWKYFHEVVLYIILILRADCVVNCPCPVCSAKFGGTKCALYCHPPKGLKVNPSEDDPSQNSD